MSVLLWKTVVILLRMNGATARSIANGDRLGRVGIPPSVKGGEKELEHERSQEVHWASG